MSVEWEPWEPKPGVVTLHAQFTGWDRSGNGFELLAWLHEAGMAADRYIDSDGRDLLRIVTPPERLEAVAERGWWFVRGTRGEVYAIPDGVHSDKYQRPAQP